MEIRTISFLIENISDQFAIRDIARRSGIDYKLVHSAVQKLADKEVIIKQKIAHADLCSLDLRGDLSPVYYVESVRAMAFLSRHPVIRNVFEAVKQRIPSVYYSLIIFGSFSKGSQTKASDLDLLIISSNRAAGEEIARIIHSESIHLGMKIHSIVVDEKEFVDNLKDKKQNVVIEAFKSHIIIAGVEGFYEGVRKTI